MTNLNQQEWIEILAMDSNAVILDVRTPDECAGGIMENAQCLDILDRDKFISILGQMDRSKNYYIYCRSGQRSGNACLMMDEMGFARTFNLIGGIMAWTGKIIQYGT